MATGSTTEAERARHVQSCMESAEAWRQNARYVRGHAARPHLTPQARATLLREAEASDRQAEWWVAEADDHPR